MTVYLRILLFFVLVFVFVSQIKSQTFEIGQSADQIKKMVELSTNEHNKPDPNGNKANSFWSFKVKNLDAQISMIIECHDEQYLLEFKSVVNFCTYYIMQNNKLSSVVTEFENIQLNDLKEKYCTNNEDYKIGDLYFSEDFEHYSRLYSESEGNSSIEWRKTVISELNIDIQQRVNNRLKAFRLNPKKVNETKPIDALTKEDPDYQKRLYTLLNCEDFSEGSALVSIDPVLKPGETNYGYGDNRYGFINEKGEYLIKPRYSAAFSFSNGFSLIKNKKNDSFWEFININGENIFDKKFTQAKSFSEGFAAIRNERGGYGFINNKGVLITTVQYDEVGDFKNGFARVKFQNKWGFIDSTGREVIYPQFNLVRDFSEELALVGKFVNYNYTQYSYIDKTGKIILSLDPQDRVDKEKQMSGMDPVFRNKMEISTSDFHEGVIIVLRTKNRQMGEVVLDKSGRVIFESKVRNLFQFKDGFSIAEIYSTFGYINKKGVFITKPLFDDAGFFHEGLAKVKLRKNWGFINESGNVVINKDILKPVNEVVTSPPFDKVSDFSNGYAAVEVRNRIGYIDKTGKFVIEPNLLGGRPFKNGIARIIPPDRQGWNYIDKNGKILFVNFL